MRSSTEVYLRNCASAAGSRDRSSRRKYSDTNRSSPVKPAAPAELGAPACIDSAARYRPAGQPSVRSVSSESSLASSSTPAASSSSPASCSSSRRSATPISSHQSLRPPAGERQRRLFPARDRDLRAGRNVLEQRREHVQTGRIGDGVQIVEHQHQRALERSQRAPDTRDALRPGGSPRARQRVEHLGRERFDAVNRGRDVAQEHHGVVVSAVERDPRERTRIGLGPPRQQRRLAVPGGRDHGHERHARRAQPCDHVRLRHGARPGQRRSELDLHEVERNFCDGHRQSDPTARPHGPRISSHRYEDATPVSGQTRQCSERTARSRSAASSQRTNRSDR